MTMPHLSDPVEILYVALMLRWEKSAPPDNHLGSLDGIPTRNSQKARLAYVLRKIAAGNPRFLPALSVRTPRQDGESYVSTNSSWMVEPCELLDGWFLEGCMKLEQKEAVTSAVVRIGHSALFGACINEFVAGRPVREFMPSIEEQEELARRLDAKLANV
jgi:hypothetical protein